MKQQTIKNPITLSGKGLHTGRLVHVTLKPAAANTGVCFVRIDLAAKPSLKVSASTMVTDRNVVRCTALQSPQGFQIFTVEHIMAALSGLGIDNVVIEIDDKELPGMDGSSLEFLKALEKAGIEPQAQDKNIFAIKEPIVVSNAASSLVIVPHDQFTISYTLDYNHPFLRSQFFSINLSPETFAGQLAAARTFCLESEVPEIRHRGLGLGSDYRTTLVISDNGVVQNTLRWPNECARHKVLDILGDLSVLGYPLKAAVYAIKSGHTLNRALVQAIEAQRQKYSPANEMRPPDREKEVSMVKKDQGRVFNIDDIMKILPHRYPFLFVDKVIEIEPGKKGLGIKNVTINDSFFQGHFPQKPVMPGVIMIEAMAQTAGVVVLTGGAHHGKVALFMSVNDVKFRKVVQPGDQLLMEVDVIRDRDRTANIKGIGRVNAEVVIEADMMFSYLERHYLYGQ